MHISVIIPTYNRAKLLDKLLDNLFQQSLHSNISWEIIVVDNNSSDNTEKIALQKKFLSPVPLIYVKEKKQGSSYARNRGVKIARGEIIAFIDDDVILDKHWLQSVWQAFRKVKANAFGGKVIPMLPPTIPKWVIRSGPFRNTGLVLGDHDFGDKISEYGHPPYYAPVGANFFLKKIIFKKYGLFREDLGVKGKTFLAGEDSEFFLRLMRQGEKVYYYPYAVVYHPVDSKRLTKRFFLKRYFGAGRSAALINPSSLKYTLRNIIINVTYILWYALKFDVITSFHFILRISYHLGTVYQYFLNKI